MSGRREEREGVGPVLEANLRALFARAWRPVLPSPAFRQRVQRDLARRVTGAPDGRARWWLPLAAAASLLAALAAGAWWYGGGRAGSPSPTPFLDRGQVAVCRALGGSWEGVGPADAARGVPHEGAFLEVITPDAAGARVLVAGGRVDLRAGSSARLWAAPAEDRPGTVAVVADLRRGAATLAPEPEAGADARWTVQTTEGRLALGGGELAVAYVDARGLPSALAAGLSPELAARVRDHAPVRLELRSGAAALSVDGGGPDRALEVGVVSWLVHGTLLGHGPDEIAAAVPAAPSVPPDDARRAVEPADRADVAGEPGAAPGATLRGRVTVADGEVPERLTVVLLRDALVPDVAEPEPYRIDLRAGEFVLEGLEPGAGQVALVAPGWAAARGRVWLEAGETAEVELALERGGGLRGRVVDAGGEPVAGAVVLSEIDTLAQVIHHDLGRAEPWMAASRTGEDGAFELPHLTPGEHVLRASRPGYAPSWSPPVRVAAGATAELEIEVAPGGSVVGRVHHPDGRPWPGAIVVAAHIDLEGRQRIMSYGLGVTDGAGRLEIHDLPPGAFAIVHVGDDEGGELASPNMRYVQVRAGETTEVSFPEEREGRTRLHGRVLDERGEPVPGCGLSLEPVGADADRRPEDWQAMRCDEEGRYEFPALVPGRYHVFIGHDFGNDMALHGTVDVGEWPEQAHDLHVATAGLEGLVRAEDGAPVPMTAVIVGIPDGEREGFAGKAVTDDQGRYRFAYLPAGEYRLIAWPAASELALGVRDGVRVAPLGRTTAEDLVLRPGGRLEVVASDARGDPVVGARATLIDERGRALPADWLPAGDGAGRLRTPPLEPGRWSVSLAREGFEPATVEARVRAGETVEVPIVLVPR